MNIFREAATPLTGVLAFPVTPFHEDCSLDIDGLAHNVAQLAQYPFSAMVSPSGTGEMYSLSAKEAEMVIRTAVNSVAGRMPVIAAVGYNAVIGKESAHLAEKAGAKFILILPPYYTNAPEEGLLAYYEGISSACNLPVIIYSRDWAAFTPKMVAKLAERIPSLAAWKDGQGNAHKYQRIMQHVGDRLAWLGGFGDECVPEYFAIGVQAYTSGLSNVAPELSLALADAGTKRDFIRLERLMKRYVHPFFAVRDQLRGYEVAALKYVMNALGLPSGPVRPPLENVRAEHRAELDRLVTLFSEFAE
jgi:5-dehydro-4-deoxyglucarate dehydratase